MSQRRETKPHFHQSSSAYYKYPDHNVVYSNREHIANPKLKEGRSGLPVDPYAKMNEISYYEAEAARNNLKNNLMTYQRSRSIARDPPRKSVYSVDRDCAILNNHSLTPTNVKLKELSTIPSRPITLPKVIHTKIKKTPIQYQQNEERNYSDEYVNVRNYDSQSHLKNEKTYCPNSYALQDYKSQTAKDILMTYHQANDHRTNVRYVNRNFNTKSQAETLIDNITDNNVKGYQGNTSTGLGFNLKESHNLHSVTNNSNLIGKKISETSEKTCELESLKEKLVDDISNKVENGVTEEVNNNIDINNVKRKMKETSFELERSKSLVIGLIEDRINELNGNLNNSRLRGGFEGSTVKNCFDDEYKTNKLHHLASIENHVKQLIELEKFEEELNL